MLDRSSHGDSLYYFNDDDDDDDDDDPTVFNVRNENVILDNENLDDDYEPIVHWLDQLQITIPDIQYTVDFFTIYIQNMTCTHFSINNIQSTYTTTANTTTNNYNNIHDDDDHHQSPQLQIIIQNISSSCTGMYSISPGTIRGTVLVQLGTIQTTTTTTTTTTNTTMIMMDSTNNALEWTMIIHDNTTTTSSTSKIRQPSTIQTLYVTTQLQVITLHFTGSVSANIIELFHDLIVNNINHAIQTQLNTIFHNTLDPILSYYIQYILHILQPYLFDIPFPSINNNTNYNTLNPIRSSTMDRNVMALRQNTHYHHHQHRYHHTTSTTTSNNKNNNKGNINHNNDPTSSSSSSSSSSSTTIAQYETDLPLLYHALQAINIFISNHLSIGFLPIYRMNEHHTSSYYSMLSSPPLPSLSSSSSSSSTTCGGFSDGINGLIESLFGTSPLRIPFPRSPHMSFTVSQYHKNITIYLHDLTISGPGWSNLSRFMLLQPNQRSTTTTNDSDANETYFHNEIEVSSNVSFIVNATIYVTDVVVDGNNNNTLNESFVVQFDLSHFHTAFDVTLDWKRFFIQHVITIGMIRSFLDELWSEYTLPHSVQSSSSSSIPINPSSSVNCIVQGIDHIFVSGLSGIINISRIAIRPTIPQSTTYLPHDNNSNSSGSTSNQHPLERDIDNLINTLLDLVLTEYPVLVTTAMSGFLQTNNTVQNYINEYLARHIVVPDNSTTDCIIQNRTPTTIFSSIWDHENIQPDQLDNVGWFNFSKIGLLRQFNTYLNQSTTITRINDYIDCSIDTIKEMVRDIYIIHDENGTDARNDTSMPTRSRAQWIELDIKHFGQFQQIQFVSPTLDGHRLQNSFLWNNTNVLESRLAQQEVLPTLFFAWKVDYVPLNITAMINVTFLLNDIQWGVDTNIHVDEEEFLKLTLMELFSYSQCMLAPINSTDFEILGRERHLHFLQVIVNTTIVMHSTNETLDILINTNDFSDTQTIISSIFEWSVDTIRDITGSMLRSFIADSRMLCYGDRSSTNDNSFNEETYNMKPMFLILLAVFMFLQPAVLLMKRPSESIVGANQQQNSHNELIEPLLHQETIAVESEIGPHDDNDDDDSSHGSEPQSFMMDRNIPFFVQYGIPITILLTIVLLLSSNLSVGATVDVVIANIYEGKDIQVPSLFAFSLYNTARDMWTAQIYPLFFLVLIFSGLWPYMKLFLMLYAWMGPTSMISPTFRGRLLLKLDALSKFSLVDTYVLIVMMVAFQYQLPLLEESSLSVYVVPKFGFFGFLLATSASLLLGHVLVYYHRHVEIMSVQLPPGLVASEFISEPNEVSYRPREALGYHAYHFEDGTKRRLTSRVQYVLLAWLMLVFVMFSIGITQKCFVFEFGGLAGVLLSEGKNRAAYSVLSFAAAIPTSTEHVRWMSTILLQFVFIFYTIIMPLAAGIFLTILWVVPMSWSSQYSLLVMAEIANAWSAVEVFCLSIVAALFEIETFANFMVGHKCDWIDQLLVSYHTTIGIDTCYSVTASITWNAAFLVVGAILHSLLISLVLRFVQLSVHERLFESQGELHDVMPELRRSLLHRLTLSRWGGLLFVCVSNDDVDGRDTTMTAIPFHDLPRDDADTILPVFSEEILTTPWEEMNDSEWKDSIERDATWKEWNETTNVT